MKVLANARTIRIWELADHVDVPLNGWLILVVQLCAGAEFTFRYAAGRSGGLVAVSATISTIRISHFPDVR